MNILNHQFNACDLIEVRLHINNIYHKRNIS